MKTHFREWAALQKADSFLFCSNDAELAWRLGALVQDLGLLKQEPVPNEQLAPRIAVLRPQIVFLDFTVDPALPGKLLQAAEQARLLRKQMPSLPLVAVGTLFQAESAISALRAGVSDFIDIEQNPEEAHEVVQRILGEDSQGAQKAKLRSVVLLGARAGVGSSTLAVHLAAMLQQRLAQMAFARQGGKADKGARAAPEPLKLSERVGLLDLGFPVGDCLLYLNLPSELDVAEAARNLRRLDETLLGSGLAQNEDGLSVMALPRDLAQMRDVSQADSVALFERMCEHFGFMVTDAGGFSDPEFIAGLVGAADETWLVTDQSVGALVSLASLLRELEHRHIDPGRLGLIVNRYDERYGMTAEQIAQRFKLRLLGSLPDRTLQLMTCSNLGQLLHEQAERDVYVKAVRAQVERLVGGNAPAADGGAWIKSLLPGLGRGQRLV
ncbi:pilus assembly protein CpaE [Orrella sp. JC864]|uniref:AAA family ATPase n=1 Tax=Orrella sp. JC864 TaxID=3120298 RepID=UPI00300A9DDA